MTGSRVLPHLPSYFRNYGVTYPTGHDFAATSVEYGGFRSRKIVDTDAFSFLSLAWPQQNLVMKTTGSSVALIGCQPAADKLSLLVASITPYTKSLLIIESTAKVGSYSDFLKISSRIARFFIASIA